MNDKKKERPFWAWIIFIIVALIVISIISYIGYAIEITPSEKNAAPVMRIINAFMAIGRHEVRYLFLDITGKFFSGTGATRKATILAFAAVLVGGVYFKYGDGKRFHKKGIEHGSAKWGSQQEKNIIADTTQDGFYNNVIVASDVFLVLDRKQREVNEKADRERAKQRVRDFIGAIRSRCKKDESEGQKNKAHAQS